MNYRNIEANITMSEQQIFMSINIKLENFEEEEEEEALSKRIEFFDIIYFLCCWFYNVKSYI